MNILNAFRSDLRFVFPLDIEEPPAAGAKVYSGFAPVGAYGAGSFDVIPAAVPPYAGQMFIGVTSDGTSVSTDPQPADYSGQAFAGIQTAGSFMVVEELFPSTPATPILTLGADSYKIELERDASELFIGYEVQGQRNSSGVWVTLTTFYLDDAVPNHWHLHTDLIGGDTWKYRARKLYRRYADDVGVLTVNGEGWSGYSPETATVVASSAEHTVWVDGTNGDDANPGISRYNAFATVQFALDRAKTLSSGGDRVLVNVLPGTYYEAVSITNGLSGGSVEVRGWKHTGQEHPRVAAGELIPAGDPGWTAEPGLGPNVYSRAWPHKFSFFRPASDDQGDIVASTDLLTVRASMAGVVETKLYTPYKADQVWTFTLPDGMNDAGGVQLTVQTGIRVSTADNAPYLGQVVSGETFPDYGSVFPIFQTAGYDPDDTNTWERIQITDLYEQTPDSGDWRIDVRRGESLVDPKAWPVGHQVTFEVGATGHTTADMVAEKGSFFVDEANSLLYVNFEDNVDPSMADVEVATGESALRLSGGLGVDQVTVRGMGFSHSRDRFNDGGQGLVVMAQADNIWLQDLDVFACNWSPIRIVGDTVQATSSVNQHIIHKQIRVRDAGGTGIIGYRNRDVVLERIKQSNINWRGHLGGWYRWNAGGKRNEEEEVEAYLCETFDVYGDHVWLDLASTKQRWRHIYGSGIGRHALFLEAMAGPVDFRHFAFALTQLVGNPTAAAICSSYGLRLFDGLIHAPGADAGLELSGNPVRWYQYGWWSGSSYYSPEHTILAVDQAGNWFEIEDGYESRYEQTGFDVQLIVAGSTGNDRGDLSEEYTTTGYTVTDVQTVSSRTRIFVAETIPDATADGTIRAMFRMPVGDWKLRRTVWNRVNKHLVFTDFMAPRQNDLYASLDTDYNTYGVNASAAFPNLKVGGTAAEAYSLALWRADLVARNDANADDVHSRALRPAFSAVFKPAAFDYWRANTTNIIDFVTDGGDVDWISGHIWINGVEAGAFTPASLAQSPTIPVAVPSGVGMMELVCYLLPLNSSEPYIIRQPIEVRPTRDLETPVITSVSATTSGELDVVIQANGNLDHDHFEVWASDVSGRLYQVVQADLADTSFTETGLADGQRRHYVVRSVDIYGDKSVFSEEVSGQALGTPAPYVDSASFNGLSLDVNLVDSLSVNSNPFAYKIQEGSNTVLKATGADRMYSYRADSGINLFYCDADPRNYDDVLVEIDVYYASDQAHVMGPAILMGDQGKFYAFVADENFQSKWKLLRYDGTTLTELASTDFGTSSPTFNVGDTKTLKLIRNGTTLIASVDGTEVFNQADAVLTETVWRTGGYHFSGGTVGVTEALQMDSWAQNQATPATVDAVTVDGGASSSGGETKQFAFAATVSANDSTIVGVEIRLGAALVATLADQGGGSWTGSTEMIPGEYTGMVAVAIANNGSEFTSAATVGVTVIPTPVIWSHADGATGVDPSGTVQWVPTGGNNDFQVSSDAGFVTLLIDASGISNGQHSLSGGGLASDTDYWMRTRDGVSDWSDVVQIRTAVAGDTTAPEWSAGPTLYGTPASDGELVSMTLNELGTYWVVMTPTAMQAPNATQIKAGNGGDGNPAVFDATGSLPALTNVDVRATDGDPSTAYKLHVYAEDVGGDNPVTAGVWSSAEFTTAALPARARFYEADDSYLEATSVGLGLDLVNVDFALLFTLKVVNIPAGSTNLFDYGYSTGTGGGFLYELLASGALRAQCVDDEAGTVPNASGHSLSAGQTYRCSLLVANGSNSPQIRVDGSEVAVSMPNGFTQGAFDQIIRVGGITSSDVEIGNVVVIRGGITGGLTGLRTVASEYEALPDSVDADTWTPSQGTKVAGWILDEYGTKAAAQSRVDFVGSNDLSDIAGGGNYVESVNAAAPYTARWARGQYAANNLLKQWVWDTLYDLDAGDDWCLMFMLHPHSMESQFRSIIEWGWDDANDDGLRIRHTNGKVLQLSTSGNINGPTLVDGSFYRVSVYQTGGKIYLRVDGTEEGNSSSTAVDAGDTNGYLGFLGTIDAGTEGNGANVDIRNVRFLKWTGASDLTTIRSKIAQYELEAYDVDPTGETYSGVTTVCLWPMNEDSDASTDTGRDDFSGNGKHLDDKSPSPWIGAVLHSAL